MLTGVRLIVALCLAEVTVMAGFGTFPGLLPTFFEEWGLSNTAAGWINGVYFGAYMVSVPLLVSLTDRVDPRRVYLVSAAVTALSSLGFAFVADGFWSASLFRALAGIGLAGTYMPGLKALTDHLPPGLQSRAVAFYTSTFSIGAASSFFLAGEVAAALDWRWAFGLAALGPGLAMLIVALLVPPSGEHHLARSETALLDFRPVIRNRSAFAYVLAYSAHNWELFALRSWLVAFLVYAQGLQPAGTLGSDWSATAIASLVIVIALPASVLGNEASERFGRRRVVIAVMSVSALIAGLLGLLAPIPFALLVACCFLYGVTVTADSASITSGAVAAARPGQRGQTMAVHSFIGFAGAFVGPLAFGVVLDLAGGSGRALAWWLAFGSSGLAVAMGPLALWLMTRRH
ncbi:MAG: nitrate/nitrite transporter [Kiloniellales bacterium]